MSDRGRSPAPSGGGGSGGPSRRASPHGSGSGSRGASPARSATGKATAPPGCIKTTLQLIKSEHASKEARPTWEITAARLPCAPPSGSKVRPLRAGRRCCWPVVPECQVPFEPCLPPDPCAASRPRPSFLRLYLFTSLDIKCTGAHDGAEGLHS